MTTASVRCTLTVDDRLIDGDRIAVLTRHQGAVLRAVATLHPTIVSFDRVAESVYGAYSANYHRVLQVHLFNLRLRMLEAGIAPIIETRRGKGLRAIRPVQVERYERRQAA